MWRGAAVPVPQRKEAFMSDRDFRDGKRDALNRLPSKPPHEKWHGFNEKDELRDRRDYARGREAGNNERKRRNR
jgi:hypothetical protein